MNPWRKPRGGSKDSWGSLRELKNPHRKSLVKLRGPWEESSGAQRSHGELTRPMKEPRSHMRDLEGSMEDLCKTHGKLRGKAQKTHGESLENPYEGAYESHERSWRTHGRHLQDS